MRSPDPLSEWSQDEISNWINGLDAGVESYKDKLKYATGNELLKAQYADLYQYGITKLGHQEYILGTFLYFLCHSHLFRSLFFYVENIVTFISGVLKQLSVIVL